MRNDGKIYRSRFTKVAKGLKRFPPILITPVEGLRTFELKRVYWNVNDDLFKTLMPNFCEFAGNWWPFLYQIYRENRDDVFCLHKNQKVCCCCFFFFVLFCFFHQSKNMRLKLRFLSWIWDLFIGDMFNNYKVITVWHYFPHSIP